MCVEGNTVTALKIEVQSPMSVSFILVVTYSDMHLLNFNFFALHVGLNHWNNLLRNVVFKMQLDMVLDNII